MGPWVARLKIGYRQQDGNTPNLSAAQQHCPGARPCTGCATDLSSCVCVEKQDWEYCLGDAIFPGAQEEKKSESPGWGLGGCFADK